MKQRVILYGIGTGYERVKEDLCLDEVEICHISDTYKYMEYETFDGYNMVSPSEIRNKNFDYLIVCSSFYRDIEKLLKGIDIDEGKIINYFDMERKTYDIFKFDAMFVNYINNINEEHFINNFKKFNVGDQSADPTELFHHYDGYGYWLASKLNSIGKNKKIIDIGNKKVINAMTSVNNEVTALVLKDCNDFMSKINYIIHDVYYRLPLDDNSFDIFTSPVSIHLLGMGRYGDKMDFNTLPNVLKEIDRVLKNKADIIISTNYGKNSLIFNNGWIFDFDTIKRLFSGWDIEDYLIDNRFIWSVHRGEIINNDNEKYTRNLDLDNYEYGEYRIMYLHLRRGYDVEGEKESE